MIFVRHRDNVQITILIVLTFFPWQVEGYSGDTVRIQQGYRENTEGYSEDTVGIQ